MGEMHDQSDAQLIRAYAEHGTEAAFAEIVRAIPTSSIRRRVMTVVH